jgi:hypothetical protein
MGDKFFMIFIFGWGAPPICGIDDDIAAMILI